MIHDTENIMIILSSPSGVGKTTLTKKIQQKNQSFKISVSHTTRTPRSNEIDGVDYFFVSKLKFKELIDKKKFYEFAKIFDNYYGTPKSFITKNLSQNSNIIFDIDWQGARSLFKKYGQRNIVSIFILPPSIDELRSRLKKRAQDSAEVVEYRMKMAQSEMSHYNEYQFILINEDLQYTSQKILSIIESFKINRIRPSSIKNFIENNLKF